MPINGYNIRWFALVSAKIFIKNIKSLKSLDFFTKNMCYNGNVKKYFKGDAEKNRCCP